MASLLGEALICKGLLPLEFKLESFLRACLGFRDRAAPPPSHQQEQLALKDHVSSLRLAPTEDLVLLKRLLEKYDLSDSGK